MVNKPVIPKVKHTHVLLKRTHIASGDFCYIAVPYHFKKNGSYSRKVDSKNKIISANTTEFTYDEVMDIEKEQAWLDENYAEAVQPESSKVPKPTNNEPPKDIKEMSIIQMATSGISEEDIKKELKRREKAEKSAATKLKNKADKKAKEDKKAKKELEKVEDKN